MTPHTHTEPGVLLNIQETCQELRLGQSTVRALIRTGELPHVRFGKSIRVPRTALNEFLAARTIGGK